MRLELARDNNNTFYIPKDRLARENLRISTIDIDGVVLENNLDYHMMGPRTVYIREPVPISDRVFGIIKDVRRGNIITK